MTLRAPILVFVVLISGFTDVLRAQEAVPAVRVLIDTSGSMKQNDPANLRIPALKLLVNLLPASAQAGVWLFDSAPQPLAEVAAVSPEWQAATLKAASKVHSRGLFTNIEAALQAATSDWSGPAGEGEQRSIVMLTDGVVDVSKLPEESATSRTRITNELLPKLQAAGVKVHTIALSAQADHELLKQISLATDGWNELAADAGALQRCFLKMFEKAVPAETLPLRDNRFEVDASIEEFTLLALHGSKAKPVRLAAPDKQEFTREHPPKDAHWVHEDDYDLITLRKPAAGGWQLIGDPDPANRVLVVTNLKMDHTALPNFVSPSDVPLLEVWFSEDGAPVRSEDLLKLVKVHVDIEQAGKKRTLELERAEQGERFSAPLTPLDSGGTVTLTMTANGQTFQRQVTQSFEVLMDWVTISSAAEPAEHPAYWAVTITPRHPDLDPTTLTVEGHLANGQEHPEAIQAELHEGKLRMQVPLPAPGQVHTLNLKASAKNRHGDAIDIPLKPLIIGAAAAHGEAGPESAAPAAEAASEHAAAAHEATHEAAAGDAGTEPHAPPQWGLSIGVAAGVNALLGGLAFWLLRAGRKRRQAMLAGLLDKLRVPDEAGTEEAAP